MPLISAIHIKLWFDIILQKVTRELIVCRSTGYLFLFVSNLLLPMSHCED